jgi:NhaP-type Na+/H+ or K+/H+ antiporter
MENILSLIEGSPLDVKHALTLLLLLVGLLSIEGRQRRFVPWVIVAGIIIALVTPIHTIEPAWPILTGILVPILMWHVALQMATARFVWPWRQILSWLTIATVFGAALYISGSQDIGSTVLLSVVAASLVWQVREQSSQRTYLSVFGLLAVAFLLAEVDLTLHSVGTWLSTLLAGAGFGLVFGVLTVSVAKHLVSPEARNWFLLGVAYGTYLFGVVLDISGIALTLMTGLVAAIYGRHAGVWPNERSLPSPLNRASAFWMLSGVWLLLGWQAHVPLTAVRVAGMGFGLIAVAVGLLVGWWLAPPHENETRSLWRRLWLNERKVFLLVGGKLLLWSPAIMLEPLIVIIALVGSSVVIGLLHYILYPFFQLIGVELKEVVSTVPDP